jgi:uncharacterized repeat protein (TIGR02543 family)
MQEILELKVISFNSNGGSSIPSQRLLKGQLLKQPDDPVKTDFLFDGWYVDNDTFAQKWDFNSSPVEDLTLHAKWIVEYISITHAAVAVTAPVMGQIPDTVAEPDNTEGEVNFSVGAVSWSPDHHEFRQGTRYTASVTLTADEGYLFIGLTSAAINGYTAEVSGNTGSAVTLSLTFEATEAKAVKLIEVETPPAKLAYTQGEALDLSGLVLRLTYTDFSIDYPVPFEDFDSMGIITSPAHGETLSRLSHNKKPVTITLGGCSAEETFNLTVKEPGAAVQINVTGSTGIMNSVNVTATLAGGTGQSVEYTYNTVDSVPAAWQTGNTFYLTDVDKVYYVFARSVANDDYNAGAPASAQAAFYTVTFNANGGTGSIPSQTVFINNTVTAPAPAVRPTRSGHDFTDWYTEPACQDKWDFTTDKVTHTLTLYAGWKPNTADITLSVEQIVDQAPSISGVTLSKTANGYPSTQQISVTGSYSNIEWKVAGVGNYAGQFVTGSGNTFTLDANNEKYGTTGGHSLMLTVYIGSNPYMVNIRFTIVP